MWRVFVALYFMYVILGPNWPSNILTGKPVRLVDTPTTLLRRSVFISYMSLLFTAWFLYSPSRSTFIYAALLSMMATMAFYTRYGPEKNLPSHLILNFVILYMGWNYADAQFFMMMLLMIFYPLSAKFLYD